MRRLRMARYQSRSNDQHESVSRCTVDKTTRTCTTCEKFLKDGVRMSKSSDYFTLGTDFYHHSFTDIQHCIASDCALCKLIWDFFMRRLPKLGRRNTSPRLQWRLDKSLAQPELTLGPWDSLGATDLIFKSEKECRPDWVDSPNASSSQSHIVSFRLAPSSDSKGVNERARAWLEDCHRYHETCSREHQLDGWAPKRLLDLHDLLETGQVRLRFGSELPTSAHYATLSHCWGKRKWDSLDCLNNNTELGLHKGRDQKSFCILFQQAMQFTRGLGILYLWIDSLCILQGVDGEWLSQASEMYNIYGNSVVNLAASASASGDQALLPSRYTDVPFDLDMLLDDQVWTRCRLEHHLLESGEFASLPLHSRAWVTQELYLCRRLIFFTEHQIYWSCTQSRCSERQSPSNIPQRAQGLVPDSAFTEWKWGANLDIKIPIGEWWKLLVQKYSRSILTYESDRLVALAGIAQDFFQKYRRMGIETQYAAGLWRHDMASQLCWKTRRPVPRFSRQRSSIAPTWSWVSHCPFVDGLSYSKVLMKVPFEVLDLSLVPVLPTSPFGPLSAGSITVKCSAYRPAKSLKVRVGRKRIIDGVDCREWTIDTDAGITFHLSPDDSEKNSKKIDSTFVFLLCYVSGKYMSDPRMDGLILHPAKSTSTVYKRWGTWQAKPRLEVKPVRTLGDGYGTLRLDPFQCDINDIQKSHRESFTII